MATATIEYDVAIPQTFTEPTCFDELEVRLRTLHESIVLNQYEAGRIIFQLHARFPHGQWLVYLKQMCKRVGMSERTARNYEEAYREMKAAGGDVLVHAAEDAGLNVNKKPVRSALADARKEHPDQSPAELAKSAKIALHKNPAVDQLPTLRQWFPSALIQRVGKGDMIDFEVWVDIPASKVQGRGSDLVNVMMTYDQLRTVKGNVRVGERGSFDKAKQFLKLNGENLPDQKCPVQ
jgi:hypothetical protein